MLKFSRYTLRQFLFLMGIVCIAVLDPFGLSSSTDDASANWLNRLLADRYADTGQREVVVVLIDDRYLLRNGLYWPMPYNEQAKLFQRLLAYKPRAVFVDLLYTHDHSRAVSDPSQAPQSQALVNVFERYQRRGIPLYLANNGLERGRNGAVNTLPSLLAVSTPSLVAWSGHGEQYPLALPTPVGVLETSALQLYREYCRGRDCTATPGDAAAAASEPPMAIQWGVHPSPSQAKVASVEPCQVPGLLTQLAHAVFWRFDNDVRANCAYTLTLSPSDLQVTAPANQALLRQLLQDKLVLVGASIAATGDLADSPLHGRVPGVYVHAMALDNLINWGMNYYRSPPRLAEFIGPIDALEGVELLLLLAFVMLKGKLDAPFFEPRPLFTQRRADIGAVTAWFGVLVVIVLLSLVVWHLNYTPANVFGLLLLSFTLFSTRLQVVFGSKA